MEDQALYYLKSIYLSTFIFYSSSWTLCSSEVSTLALMANFHVIFYGICHPYITIIFTYILATLQGHKLPMSRNPVFYELSSCEVFPKHSSLFSEEQLFYFCTQFIQLQWE